MITTSMKNCSALHIKRIIARDFAKISERWYEAIILKIGYLCVTNEYSQRRSRKHFSEKIRE